MAERKLAEAQTGGASRGAGLFTGIFIGILIGIGMALAVAVWLNLRGSPFQHRESPAEVPPLKQLAEPPKARDDAGRLPAEDAAAAAEPAAGVAIDERPAGAPDLPGRMPRAGAASGLSSQPSSRISLPLSFYLQAGAFRSAAEADDRRSRLTLLGQAASVQQTEDASGALHRVRVGPFATQAELERARAFLRSSGIDSIPVRPDAVANH
jgi:cell division protein FtsN